MHLMTQSNRLGSVSSIFISLDSASYINQVSQKFIAQEQEIEAIACLETSTESLLEPHTLDANDGTVKFPFAVAAANSDVSEHS